jgi:hypothetical protein
VLVCLDTKPIHASKQHRATCGINDFDPLVERGKPIMAVFAASTGFWSGIATPANANNTKAIPSQKVFE